MAIFDCFGIFPIFSYSKWSKLIENGQFWPCYATFPNIFLSEVVQIDSEQPILAILQLFQYFPTEVVQID